jgi:hypothetical protein
MKKTILAIMLAAMSGTVFAVFPFFYGARSLSLGYASMAFNTDYNAVHLNPALLSTLPLALGGLQYQSSALDHFDFAERLQRISALDLKNFQDLDLERKEALRQDLRDVFSARSGIHGFQTKSSGYAGKGYGAALEFVDAAVVFPLASEVLDKDAALLTNEDIASLQMRFLGFKYRDYSVSYSFLISQGLSLGATVHYLNGKTGEFNVTLVDEPFQPDSGPREYLQHAWSGAEKSFSKFTFDVGVQAELGPYFKAAVLVKNVAEPTIDTDFRILRLPRRVIAGLAFRPDITWGIFLDIDVAKSDLYHDGQEVQPLALGLEKGLFKNRLFLRAGLRNDLSEKYFFGRRAKVVYGLGLGFNLGSFVFDFGMGLDGSGKVKNLGFSGFYTIKGKN